MNRRQIIHWCQGQHAAAYFLEKRRGRVGDPLSLEERVDQAFSLADCQLERFRLGLFYDNGRMMYYPNRMTFKKNYDLPDLPGFYPDEHDTIAFKTGSIEANDLLNLAHVGLFDHEGVLIGKLYVSKKTMNEFKGLSAPILFNLRKKGPDERIIEGKS